MRDELLSPEPQPEDLERPLTGSSEAARGDLIGEEGGLRPRRLDEFVGQRDL